jgi:hypothetical protein
MPYWIHAKIKESAFSVVVETAKDTLTKLAELTAAGPLPVAARDMSGAINCAGGLHCIQRLRPETTPVSSAKNFTFLLWAPKRRPRS